MGLGVTIDVGVGNGSSLKAKSSQHKSNGIQLV